MKAIIEIEFNPSSLELDQRVRQFFTTNYQKLADYANYYRHNQKANIDIFNLLSEIQVKTQCIEPEELARLVFSKDSAELHFCILRQIQDTIHRSCEN